MEGLLQVGFGLFGLAVLIGITWLFSNNKRRVDWKLVVTGRSRSKLEETATLCIGNAPYIVAGDISDEKTVLEVFEAAKREYG